MSHDDDDESWVPTLKFFLFTHPPLNALPPVKMMTSVYCVLIENA